MSDHGEHSYGGAKPTTFSGTLSKTSFHSSQKATRKLAASCDWMKVLATSCDWMKVLAASLRENFDDEWKRASTLFTFTQLETCSSCSKSAITKPTSGCVASRSGLMITSLLQVVQTCCKLRTACRLDASCFINLQQFTTCSKSANMKLQQV